MVEQPIEAAVVPASEPHQGCLTIGALTTARLLVHFVVLLVVISVLVGPVRMFMRFFEQEELKLPAITVLIVNLSYRMHAGYVVIIPVLLAIDACILVALQLSARPWRFLARVWFSSVLVGAILLMALTVFSMAVPIDARLAPGTRFFIQEDTVEQVTNENQQRPG
jgi:hypothetical protein